ncbi:hypothetical protein F2981_22090 (plasmid) [Sinorhizobium meliloti]|nr:hypothetical protein [Sinorhizobium meliloti]
MEEIMRLRTTSPSCRDGRICRNAWRGDEVTIETLMRIDGRAPHGQIYPPPMHQVAADGARSLQSTG